MYSKVIPLSLIVASLTSTSLGLHHLAVTARRSLELISRQTNACSTVCDPITTTVESCTTITCLCTSAIATGIQACVNCSVENDPTISVVSTAQNLIDTFETTCQEVTGIPSLSIPTGTSQSTPIIATTAATATLPGVPVSSAFTPSTAIPSIATTIIPATTVSQLVIGPSGSTTGLPPVSGASSDKIVWHWALALLGLAAGHLLVF